RKLRLGIGAHIDHRVLDRLALVLHEMLETGMFLFLVAAIELHEEFERVTLAVRDLVEVLLHLRGEANVDVITEMIPEQTRDGKGREAGHERLALARNVAAALNGRDRRRIRRWAADAFFFEPLHERRFGVTRRRRRLVALRVKADKDQ